MKFIQVNPDDIEAFGSDGARGGVIAPIIKGFLDTGFYMVEIDCAEIGRKPASVSASVAAYAKHHIAAVRPILRGSHLFLCRRDVTKDGAPIENWKDALLEDKVTRSSPMGEGDFKVEAVPLKIVKK